MAQVNGCEIPEDLYYFLDKHSWAKPLSDGRVRVGMTMPAVKMAGTLTAVTPRSKNIGRELARGKSIGTMESSKYVGPIPTPVSGTLVTINQAVQDKPNLLVDDPYGQGWVAELSVSDWDKQKGELATGQAAVDGYRTFMDKEGYSCN